MLISLTKPDILKLAQVVREETGNHIQEKNYSMLESRIRGHILKLGFESFEDYWIYFQSNEKQERQLLKSLMTTHYTFFFREYAHFEVLEKWITDEEPRLKDRFEKQKEPVRVWSAACSRGQEVYSLAMFLEFKLFKEFGIPFEILGTDIDIDSVAHAKNGVYSIQEVNTVPQMYLNGLWKRGTGPIKDFAAIHPNLKAKTHFEVLNLLEIPKWTNASKFDVIFCRNVFIYFSEENVRKIALDLAKKVETNGLLISGMSEPLRFSEWPLCSIGPSCYQNAPKRQKLPESIQVQQAPYRVLCVDDSSTIQLLIKKIFASDSLCQGVDVAINGREAREKLDLKKYDLITLDIHMPEVSGIEFLEELYNRKSDPPVLMISSVNRTDVELATKSMSLGAFDYVEKPAMNNLQKSTDEILTKAKMALRCKTPAEVKIEGSFDASIGQKIVVPDASQCIRVVVASAVSLKQLEQVIKGQKNEYRSPALLIIWDEKSASETNIEAQLLSWTEKQIVKLRDDKQRLRPNQIFIAETDIYQIILSELRVKSASLQILCKTGFELSALKKIATTQVLVDESIGDYAQIFEKKSSFKVSDITPVTSFPSLSAEFFANLRKAG